MPDHQVRLTDTRDAWDSLYRPVDPSGGSTAGRAFWPHCGRRYGAPPFGSRSVNHLLAAHSGVLATRERLLAGHYITARAAGDLRHTPRVTSIYKYNLNVHNAKFRGRYAEVPLSAQVQQVECAISRQSIDRTDAAIRITVNRIANGTGRSYALHHVLATSRGRNSSAGRASHS